MEPFINRKFNSGKKNQILRSTEFFCYCINNDQMSILPWKANVQHFCGICQLTVGMRTHLDLCVWCPRSCQSSRTAAIYHLQRTYTTQSDKVDQSFTASWVRGNLPTVIYWATEGKFFLSNSKYRRSCSDFKYCHSYIQVTIMLHHRNSHFGAHML